MKTKKRKRRVAHVKMYLVCECGWQMNPPFDGGERIGREYTCVNKSCLYHNKRFNAEAPIVNLKATEVLVKKSSLKDTVVVLREKE